MAKLSVLTACFAVVLLISGVLSKKPEKCKCFRLYIILDNMFLLRIFDDFDDFDLYLFSILFCTYIHSSNLCKLFCIVHHNRLTAFCDSHKVIPCEQIGFRKGSRTQDHILVLKTIIDKYISKSKKTVYMLYRFLFSF